MDAVLVRRILSYELERAGFPWLSKGWNSRLFDIRPHEGDALVDAGVLRLVPGDPARGVRYLLVDREAAALASQPAGEKVTVSPPDDQVVTVSPPDDQVMTANQGPDFGDIVGYDDVKQLISESLGIGARVHYLLLGPPGSAKTLFLLAVEELPGSAYVLGSRMSRSGLAGFLMDAKPRFLLVDEIDKMPARDLAPLLSLTESGRVVEVLNRKRREEAMGTVVFAAANSVKRIPAEVQSRFQILEFPEYTRDEFIEVCKRVLVRREGLSMLEAGQVAIRVLDELRSKDVRTAVRVARLARTSLGVDGVVEIFKNYRVGQRRR